MPALMDRIYCHDFLSMTEREQIQLVERIRATRTSALAAAQIKSQRITKSAIKNIAKRSGTSKGKRMMKDPAKAATAALKKLSPEQIAAIIKDFPKE
jgi:hypothetical protein